MHVVSIYGVTTLYRNLKGVLQKFSQKAFLMVQVGEIKETLTELRILDHQRNGIQECNL